MNEKDLKSVVKEKYGKIASQSNLLSPTSCCCTSGCCDDLKYLRIGEQQFSALPTVSATKN